MLCSVYRTTILTHYDGHTAVYFKVHRDLIATECLCISFNVLNRQLPNGNRVVYFSGHSLLSAYSLRLFKIILNGRFYDRDEDPDPVGSGDFWPAGSGSGTFFSWSGSGSGSYLKQWIYKIIFILNNGFISISGRIRSRSRNFFWAEPDPDPWKKIPDPHPCLKVIEKKCCGAANNFTG